MIVWLASYPRSGNTFLRIIINNNFGYSSKSIYEDFDVNQDENTAALVGHEHSQKLDIASLRKCKKIHFIKTHEKFNRKVIDTEKDKIIYLIRDGRESSVSFTYHQNNYFENHNKTFLDTIMGNNFVGSWSNHVLSWTQIEKASILLIKFEDLVSEPERYINKISSFLDIVPLNYKIQSFKELNNLNSRFFRAGRINSWEDELSKEEKLIFEYLHGDTLNKFGYKSNLSDININVIGAKTITYVLEQIYNVEAIQHRVSKTNLQNQKEINELLIFINKENMELKNEILQLNKKLSIVEQDINYIKRLVKESTEISKSHYMFSVSRVLKKIAGIIR